PAATRASRPNRCRRCSPPPMATWASPTTCAPPWRRRRPRSRRRSSTIRCTTPPPATGPSAPAACARPPRSARIVRASPRACSKRWRSWPRTPTRCCWSAMTPGPPGCSRRSRTAKACWAPRWCSRARAPVRASRRRCATARPATARARWPCAAAPTRWHRCCRCSTRWHAAATASRCMQGPAATCSWTSRMAEQPLLHRGNVAVVVPALNESLRIAEVVAGALEQSDLVIVVDDGSDDDTAAIVAGTPAVLLRHPRRMGKGRALRDGFAEALRRGVAAVVTMDGDGQHDARDIPRLVAAANAHPGHIIIGARLRKRSTQPWYRRLGNAFGDWGIAWGCGFGLVDSQSGQRLYPAPVLALEEVPGEG